MSDGKDVSVTNLGAVRRRLARLAPYFEGLGGAMLAVLAGILVVAATEPAIPALMKPLLDRGFQGGQLALWLVPVALLGLFAVRGLAGFVAQYCLSWIANRAMLALRARLFSRLQDAPVSLFAGTSASALSNTLVYEVQNGVTLLLNAGLSFVKDAFTLVALLGYLLYLNWKLTLIVLVVFPGVNYVMKVLSRRLSRITRATQEATDQLAYVVEENVLAHREVRLHQAGDAQARRFEALGDELRRLALKATVAASAMTPLTQMLAACALSAVIVIALWQSNSSQTTVGGFAAFVTAMLMLIAPLKRLSEVAVPTTRGLAAVERGLDLLDSVQPEQGGTHAPATCAGRIRFDAVTVHYPTAQSPALDALTLDIAPGETVALVGPSGAGKTTLVNLLPRFVHPTGGRVLLDEVPVQDWDLGVLRRQFAYVSQQVVMFNDTLAANVTLGQPVDRERVAQVLEAAQLSGLVAALPQGIDTVLGHNASQLSGGQRQRLAIARALYKDAPVLILDEATSALDNESEAAVKTAIARLCAGRTTLVIAHRLSTIEHADRIVVLQAGRVVESGTHQALLAADGVYARLRRLASASGSDALPETTSLSTH